MEPVKRRAFRLIMIINTVIFRKSHQHGGGYWRCNSFPSRITSWNTNNGGLELISDLEKTKMRCGRRFILLQLVHFVVHSIHVFHLVLSKNTNILVKVARFGHEPPRI